MKENDANFRDELINKMIGDDALFLIDCSRDKRTTIHDRCEGANNYTDDDIYSCSIDRYVNTCVAPSDREMMREATAMATMLARTKQKRQYSVDYRDISTGITLFYEMRVAAFSDTEVLQSFREKDKILLDKLIYRKMEEEYFVLCVVDLDSETVKAVKNSSCYKFGEIGESVPYAPAIKAFAEQLYDEPKAFFTQLADLDYVRKELAKEDKYTYSYKSSLPGTNNWVDVTTFVLLRHEDGTPEMFSLGFSMADSYRAYRQENQVRMKEDMQMIGGLASGYHALYYFNMDDNIFKIYSLDGKRVNELQEYVSEDGDPYEMLCKFGFSNLVHPDDQWILKEITVDKVREKLAHRKKFSVRFRRNIDGEYLWTEMDVIKYEDIDERPNVIAIGFAVRDEEIRKELEQQKKLEDALVAAEAASKSKTSFLFNMSHDIRTPMNAMLGFTAMARKYSGDKKKVKEYLDKIDISEHQLLTLINQVLEMARIESGKIEFDEKPLNLPARFNMMATVMAEQARANGQEFNHTLVNIRHRRVLADEARINSVSLNIIGNALKYTPEGGRIDVTLQEIEPRKEGYATYVFTVEDTGIGMSEEYIKKLYEPFTRENSSTVSRIQGTGLGMSIVKNLVDLMGGSVDVESEPGKGTKFIITADFRIDTELNKEHEQKLNVRKVSFEGRRVLLVEDNEMNREIAKSILEETGCMVDSADDGDISVGIIQKIVDRDEPNYYDCILMDVQMPRMNGYVATKEIREILDPLGIHIPIIAMTANAFSEDRQDAIAAGMDEHLAKPIDIQRCFEVLMKFMG